jgi:hypothetical protein
MSTTIICTLSVIEKTLFLTTSILYGIQTFPESLWLSLSMFCGVALLLYAYVRSYIRHTLTWMRPCNVWFAILLICLNLFRHKIDFTEFFEGINLLGFITLTFNILYWAVWGYIKYNSKRKFC